MVYFLNINGDFLRIFMFIEDGLSGIKYIVLDIFGWLWVGCKDKVIYYVNY